MSQTKPPILRLPTELHIEILSYLLTQGDTVVIDEGNKFAPRRRRWNKELERLKDPKWKPPKRTHHPEVLLTCRALYMCGVQTFWGGNDFIFSNQSTLQGFIGSCHDEARMSIKTITFGDSHGHDIPVIFGGPWDAWAVDGRLPSLSLLHNMPNLRSLEVFVGSLRCLAGMNPEPFGHRLVDDLYGSDLPACLSGSPLGPVTGCYARDLIIKSIPDTIFSQLKVLRMRYIVQFGGRKWLTKDVLQYAQDIRSGLWSICPYQVRNEEGRWSTTDDEMAWKAHLWLEARAAVYWDYEATTRWGEQGMRMQWATWSQEWWLTRRERGLSLVYDLREAPRPWEEMFDCHGEMKEGCGMEEDPEAESPSR